MDAGVVVVVAVDDDDVGMIVVATFVKDPSFDENTTKVNTTMRSKGDGVNKTEKGRFKFVINNSCSVLFGNVLLLDVFVLVFGRSLRVMRDSVPIQEADIIDFTDFCCCCCCCRPDSIVVGQVRGHGREQQQ